MVTESPIETRVFQGRRRVQVLAGCPRFAFSSETRLRSRRPAAHDMSSTSLWSLSPAGPAHSSKPSLSRTSVDEPEQCVERFERAGDVLAVLLRVRPPPALEVEQ
jgi:hypothetical protein